MALPMRTSGRGSAFSTPRPVSMFPSFWVHLIQTVAAARLMGATAIVTGISADVAQALVAFGVDLGRINTMSDLQGGLEEADRLLGVKAALLDASAGPQPQM